MKFLKGFGIFLSIIVSIIIFVVSVVLIVYSSTKNVTSGNNIKKIITKDNVMELKIDNKTIKQTIKDNIVEGVLEQKTIDAIIDSKEFIDLIGNVIGDTVDYAIKGGNKPVISDKDWDNFVNVVINNVDLADSEKEEARIEIKKLKSNVEEAIPSREEIISDNETNDILDIYNKVKPIYIVIVIVVLMLLIALFTWNLYKPLKYAGIPFIISGLLFTIVGLLKNVFSDLFVKLLDSSTDIIGFIVNNVFGYLLINGLIVLVSGIIMIVLFKLIKNKRTTTLEETKINIEQIKI